MENKTQEEALEALNTDDNFLLTGGAGVGKSYVIKEFANNTNKNIVLTATTGIAAINLGAETIHRFLSLGTSTRPFEIPKLLNTWEKIKRSSTPWDKSRMAVMRTLDAIVIDEISMLRRDQFEIIDAVLASIKDNSLPFGGVQIIASGDFAQIPPVITDDDLIKYADLKKPYCFESDLWQQAGFTSLMLTKNFRQSSGKFLEALGEIRLGKVSDEVNDMLESRINAKLDTDIKPIKLFSHKYKVDQENIDNLNQLSNEKIHSHAIFTGKEYDIEALKRDCPAETTLSFCKCAQVMMLTNDPDGKYANGTMGIIEEVSPVKIRLASGIIVEVEKFTWERNNHKISGNDIVEKVVSTMTQYPFRLSWATSIHKSQSLTMDYVEMDLSKIWEYGQAYTALSRVKTLEGLKLTGWNRKVVKANKKVLDFYGY